MRKKQKKTVGWNKHNKLIKTHTSWEIVRGKSPTKRRCLKRLKRRQLGNKISAHSRQNLSKTISTQNKHNKKAAGKLP